MQWWHCNDICSVTNSVWLYVGTNFIMFLHWTHALFLSQSPNKTCCVVLIVWSCVKKSLSITLPGKLYCSTHGWWFIKQNDWLKTPELRLLPFHLSFLNITPLITHQVSSPMASSKPVLTYVCLVVTRAHTLHLSVLKLLLSRSLLSAVLVSLFVWSLLKHK